MSSPSPRAVLDVIATLRSPGLDPAATERAWVDLVTTATGNDRERAAAVVRSHPPRVAAGPGLDTDAALGQLDLWVAHLPQTGDYGHVPTVLDRLTDDLYAHASGPAPSASPAAARQRGPRRTFLIVGGLVGAVLLAVGVAAGGLLARGGDVGAQSSSPSEVDDSAGAAAGGSQAGPDGLAAGGDFLTLAAARAEQQGYLDEVQQQAEAALAGAGLNAVTWTTTGDAEAGQSGLCEIYGPGLTAWQIDRESAVPIDGAAARTVLDAITSQAPADPRVEVRTVRTAYTSDVAISWPAGLGGATSPGVLPAVQSATEVRLGWAPAGEAALDAAPATVPGTLRLSARSPCARG